MNIQKILVLSAMISLSGLALPARAAEFIEVTQDSIRIEASKGVLIRLKGMASTVFVANPEIADVQVKSPRLIYVTGKQAGETSLYAVDEHDKILLSRKITVIHNLSRLRKTLNEFLPDAAIDVRSIDGAIILSGSVRTASDSEDARRIAARMVPNPEDLINKLAVTAPNQVNLRVRIAEVSRTVIKEFGINWGAVINRGFLFGLATGGVSLLTSSTISGTVSLSNSGMSTAFSNNNVSVTGLIDALDEEGLVKILAEPNLTAISGETATFLAGGEFPIIVPDDDGDTTIEFKEFGVSLSYTPTILANNRINLKVRPEVSQLSAAGAVTLGGFVVPSLTTRRTETTVELASGQSFAIAGLIQNNHSSNVDKFPFLGDIPIMGALFRSEQFKRDETELVIIITPYIVRPVSSGKMALPTDGLIPPTDSDRILRGRMRHPNKGATGKGKYGPRPGGLVGPVGFVLD